MAPKYKANRLTEHQLEKFIKDHYVANRMSLVATGVEHEPFVALADKIFNFIPSSTATITKEAAKYTGGIAHIGDNAPYNQLAIVFEGPSLQNDKDFVAQLVLDTVLGGGDVNSMKEFGTGHSTRLFKNILAKHGFVKSINSFSVQYSDSGLAGAYAEVDWDKLSLVTQAIISELAQLRKSISQEELSKAKRQLKATINFQLENTTIYHEDLGRLAAVKKNLSPQQLLQAIDSVTADDLVRVATKSLSTPPTLVTLGHHIHSAFSYSELLDSIKSSVK